MLRDISQIFRPKASWFAKESSGETTPDDFFFSRRVKGYIGPWVHGLEQIDPR